MQVTACPDILLMVSDGAWCISFHNVHKHCRSKMASRPLVNKWHFWRCLECFTFSSKNRFQIALGFKILLWSHNLNFFQRCLCSTFVYCSICKSTCYGSSQRYKCDKLTLITCMENILYELNIQDTIIVIHQANIPEIKVYLNRSPIW